MAMRTVSAIQRTFATIKPHAVKEGKTGAIIDLIEQNGFTIAEMRQLTMTKAQAEKMYQEHSGKDFFPGLIVDITSGPIVAFCLEKENAIANWRQMIGATNPADAAEGTLRKLFGKSRRENAAHGSDSVESATMEIGIFF